MDFIKKFDFNILGAVFFFGLFVLQVINYKKIKLNRWITFLLTSIGILLTVWMCYLAFLS